MTPVLWVKRLSLHSTVGNTPEQSDTLHHGHRHSFLICYCMISQWSQEASRNRNHYPHFTDGEAEVQWSHIPSNLQNQDSKAVSVISFLVRYSDIGGGDLRWEDFEMDWLVRTCLDCFCLALPSAQNSIRFLLKACLDLPHTPSLSRPWPCFVSLHAADHYLPLCDILACGLFPPLECRSSELRDSALSPLHLLHQRASVLGSWPWLSAAEVYLLVFLFVCFNPYLRICLLIWERESEGERDTHINVREKHWLVASCMWLDWGLNLQASYVPWLGINLATVWGMQWYSNQLSRPVRASTKVLIFATEPLSLGWPILDLGCQSFVSTCLSCSFAKE